MLYRQGIRATYRQQQKRENTGRVLGWWPKLNLCSWWSPTWAGEFYARFFCLKSYIILTSKRRHFYTFFVLSAIYNIMLFEYWGYGVVRSQRGPLNLGTKLPWQRASLVIQNPLPTQMEVLLVRDTRTKFTSLRNPTFEEVGFGITLPWKNR